MPYRAGSPREAPGSIRRQRALGEAFLPGTPGGQQDSSLSSALSFAHLPVCWGLSGWALYEGKMATNSLRLMSSQQK